MLHREEANVLRHWKATIPVILSALILTLALVACGKATPESVVVSPQAAELGPIFSVWSTGIQTTTVQSATVSLGRLYSKAQVWLSVDISSTQTLTPSIRTSVDAANWIEIGRWQSMTVDSGWVYTTESSLGPYLNVAFQMTNTNLVTPTAYVFGTD